MEPTNSHHHDANMSNFTTFICWICSGLFYGIQHLTAESVYTWTFRILSLISVIMVIIINWPKVKAVLFKKKRADENRD